MSCKPPVSRRIAFINSWHRDPARGSGTAVAIQGLAAGLKALGHEVTLVEPSEPAATVPRRVAFNLEARGHLRGHRHSLVVGFDFDGLFVPRRADRPYVVSLKGVAADESRFERGMARARLITSGMLERQNARRAGLVIVTSRYARDRAVLAYGLEPTAVRVVPEGIPFHFWSRDLEDDVPRRPTIVSVARFYPRKNLATLLAAMPAVRAAIPEARLVLIGAGPEASALRRQAASLGLNGAVEFLGPLADPVRVRAELWTASLFCLPSLQEGFGIAFLEAMAAGLPIVGGAAGAVPEVVPHGEAGYLVPPRDGAALTAALIRVLGDPALRSRLGDVGRRHAAHYDWPLVAARFLEAAVQDTGLS